ncbi:MAG: hypothetical protein JST40_02190 [Armatimonadetes bacterium]|nr:hypothetical protein [Armatimonadota bacterium]
MATLDDVRRICSELEGAVEGSPDFGFGVLVKGKVKGYVWSWKERVEPKKPRVENLEVVAIRLPNLLAKEVLENSSPGWWVDDPHYHGYPAVLVRLEKISVEELADLLIEGHNTFRSGK